MTQKVALVTGGAAGIVKATAMILARKGVKVVISGRREALGQKAITHPGAPPLVPPLQSAEDSPYLFLGPSPP